MGVRTGGGARLMRFTVTVETGKQRSTMTVPAAVAVQIEEAAKHTGRGCLSMVNSVLACGMDSLMRQLDRKRMAEEAAARRATSRYVSPAWINGRNALVTRTAADDAWLMTAYDTERDSTHRIAGTATFTHHTDATVSGRAWTFRGEWRIATARTFTVNPTPEQARADALGGDCAECEGEGRILRGTDEGDYATCPDCDGSGKAGS